MAAAKSMQCGFSFKTFGIGLLAVALIYALLAVYLILIQNKTMFSLEANLASQTVLVDGQGEYTAPVDEAEPIHTEEGLGPEDREEAPHNETATSDAEEHAVEATPEVEETPVATVESEPETAKALERAPVVGLFEETSFGWLPIAKGPDETPFTAYKKPFILNHNQPFIAMAVQDFGLSREVSMQMISDLPSSVAFILSPYSSQPESWVQRARDDGHEVWLHMPMETLDFPLADPGSKGLLTRVSLQYNQDRLGWLLGQTTGYAGVAAFTDNALDNAGNMFKNIARSTFRRGLGFFELNPSESYLMPIAQEEGIPRVKNSSTIDFLEPKSAAMDQAKFRIEGNGGAVVVVAASAHNITVLKDWIGRLQREGIQSVPLSAVAEMNSGL